MTDHTCIEVDRRHDLPPRWDGLPVRWDGWMLITPLICHGDDHLAATPPEVCQYCGSDRQPPCNLGRAYDGDQPVLLIAVYVDDVRRLRDALTEWLTAQDKALEGK